MSIIDKIRSFAGARCEDDELITDAILTYGEIREILEIIRQKEEICPS